MGGRTGARLQLLTNVKDAANSFGETLHNIQVLCIEFSFVHILWCWFASDLEQCVCVLS